MALHKQKFREIVFEILYGFDFQETDEKELVRTLMKEHKATTKNVRDAFHEAKKVFSHKDAIDEMIEEVSNSFDLKRIHTIERAILRLSFFEIFIEKSVPLEVGIDEAKRLARKYATDEAAAFIHGLIDKTVKEADA